MEQKTLVYCDSFIGNGAGAGGYIAVFVQENNFQGALQSHGGPSDKTESEGHAGLVYIEEGRSGTEYKILIADGTPVSLRQADPYNMTRLGDHFEVDEIHLLNLACIQFSKVFDIQLLPIKCYALQYCIYPVIYI